MVRVEFAQANMLQFLRYLFIGLFSNLAGYGIYLLVTTFWLSPKTTVSLFYPVAALLAYLGHHKYTFFSKGKHFHQILKYFSAHALGYLLNLSILLVFVDILGYPHQLVQLGAIVIVALYLFVALKVFVFNSIG